MIKHEMQTLSFSPKLGTACEGCQKKSHFLNLCPILHFVPDRPFLISRILHSEEQKRAQAFRKPRRGKSALKHWASIKENAQIYELSSSSDSDSSEEEKDGEGKHGQVPKAHTETRRLSDPFGNKNTNLVPIREMDERQVDETPYFSRKPSQERPLIREIEQVWPSNSNSLQIPD